MHDTPPTEPEETATAARSLAHAIVDHAGRKPHPGAAERDPGEAGSAKWEAEATDLDARLATFDAGAFGRYWAFGDEKSAIEGLIERLAGHLRAPGDKPLSVAVFGPPGCGKSFAVEEIVDFATRAAGVKTAYTVINLTQMSDPLDLATALQRALVPEDAAAVPVVFFDEFDASQSGTALGWLSWFLAPMNDGEFRRAGARVRTGPAVFIFAGGTSQTADAFARREGDGFRAAKGPDFVSRLAATFDVPGPNHLDPKRPWHRLLRRALLVRGPFGKLHGRVGAQALRFDADLLNTLLDIDRYTHGARSVKLFMQALAEPDGPKGSPAPRAQVTVNADWVPTDGRLDPFFDRGRLDPAIVRGPVHFSGGARRGEQVDMESLWARVAGRVFAEGASIIYGGPPNWGEATNDLVSILARDASLARERLPEDPRESVRLWLFGDTAADTHHSVGLLDMPTADTRGGAADSGDAASEEKQRMLALFRMRLAIARRSVACVAMGGKTEGWEGRMPGLLAEIVINLMHRRPIYLLGGPGMAVGDIGRLLGLDETWHGTPAWLKRTGRFDAWVTRQADLFRWPGAEDAPLTCAEAVRRLRRFALGSEGWVDNGLTPAENRELFRLAPAPLPDVTGEALTKAEARQAEEAGRAADLVIKGLTRVLEAR